MTRSEGAEGMYERRRGSLSCSDLISWEEAEAGLGVVASGLGVAGAELLID